MSVGSLGGAGDGLNGLDPLIAVGNWNEPKTAYGKVKGKKIKKKKGKSSTIYPFNKVQESESGHIFEIDDTPGSERIHLFHRSGTFQEIHPNGDSVTKVVRDNYTSILRDDYVHIDGHCNVTIDKALKILVNADKTPNVSTSAVNFDIEVGENANVNIIINRGNCNVRLKNGDANFLLNHGDVNIRQEAGNYNHFVNGDYNLEVAGHMHMVVGEDHVTEIGGNRDVRVDGTFDNLMLTMGYKETTILLGDLKCNILAGNKQLFVGKAYSQTIGVNKLTNILGLEEKTVGISYSISSPIISLNGIVGAGGPGMGFDITPTGYTISHPMSINFVSPVISVTGTTSVDIFSPGTVRMNSGIDTHILSGGLMNMTSGISLNLLSEGTVNTLASGGIFTTGSSINLNGIPAVPIPAEPAIGGIMGLSTSRITPPLLPTIPIIPYVPGSMGVWRRTINGVTPMILLRTSIMSLKAQLAILDTAANTIAGLKGQTGGIADSSTILKSITEGIGSALSPVTKVMADVTNGAAEVVANVQGAVDNVTGTIQDIASIPQEAMQAAISEVTALTEENGFIEGIKGALGAVTGFIGDIAQTITDIMCTIIDAIGGALDAVMKAIDDAIAAIMKGINAVLDTIGAVIDKIMEVIGKIIKAITDAIAKVFDAIGGFIDDIMAGIDDIFSSLGGKPIGCGQSVQAEAAETANQKDYSAALANGEISAAEYDRLVNG